MAFVDQTKDRRLAVGQPEWCRVVVLGGVILAAIGHDPDSQTDPSFWQMAVAGIPSVIVLILPCVLVVWFGRRALGRGVEGGREATKAGLAVGATLVLMKLVSPVLRLVVAAV
ncbi:MAG: hypothetical protein OEW83_21680 [Acidimicrobiia bacterium]|nr:hypothetical protein [Acidimicrobiia bacterium]